METSTFFSYHPFWVGFSLNQPAIGATPIFFLTQIRPRHQVIPASEGSLVPVGRHKGRGSLAPAMRLAARKLKDLEGGNGVVWSGNIGFLSWLVMAAQQTKKVIWPCGLLSGPLGSQGYKVVEVVCRRNHEDLCEDRPNAVWYPQETVHRLHASKGQCLQAKDPEAPWTRITQKSRNGIHGRWTCTSCSAQRAATKFGAHFRHSEDFSVEWVEADWLEVCARPWWSPCQRSNTHKIKKVNIYIYI